MELLNIKPIKIRKKIRKSGFEDAFFFIAVIMTIAIVILILNKAWSSMNEPLAESIQSSLPAGSGVNVSNNFAGVTSTTLLFDKLLPFIIIGLFAFVFIGAAFYMNSPIMIVVGLVVLSIAIMLGAIYANIYHQISSSDEFTSTNASLPITELFMKYLPYIMIIMLVGIVVAVIWSRSSSTGGSL